MSRLRVRGRVLPAVVVAAAVLLSGCSGDDPDPGPSAATPSEPPGCTVLDTADVALLLGVDDVEAQDATTSLSGRDPNLGCRWESAVDGTALTVKVVSTMDDQTPEAAVAGWRQACSTPTDLDLAGAVGAICGDGAFDREGTELFAVYDDGGMTMRLGLRRDGGAEADDPATLVDVARRLTDDVTLDDYERLVDRVS
ncbi:MAG: hypothetical protein Q7T56_13850 [Nocardioidaceae bacterium]|nr:hypothetical protein [Nocardioidaceae bacterium]